MKSHIRCGLLIATVAASATLTFPGHCLGQVPSGFGSGFNVQDFFKPFRVDEIKPENRQKWPYSRHVFSHWDEFAFHGVAEIPASGKPVQLRPVTEPIDLNVQFQDGRTFIESLQSTQTSAFLVLKNNEILAEFYDNGFNVDDTMLLQSASKTITAVVVHKLIEQGKIDPSKTVEFYLEGLKGSDIGRAPVQSLLDMTSGLRTLFDYHKPGTVDQQYEIELGYQKGPTKGLLRTIAEMKAEAAPSVNWRYNDMNTDTLAMIAASVTGKKFQVLLAELFNEIGFGSKSSVGIASDGNAAANGCISTTARDYALFHQWIAQGKAPKSFYESARDTTKTLINKDPQGKLLGWDSYGSFTYYLHEEDVLVSVGSFGMVGFSDMKTGTSVIFLQIWGANVELEKYALTTKRGLHMINAARQK